MDAYLWCITAGLGIATAVNLYQARALYLIFFAFAFILIAGQLLPNPSAIPEILQPYWFFVLSAVELAFMCCALATQAKQARCIAVFSGCNIIGHAFGYVTFTHNMAAYEFYEVIIRWGEASQVIALTLLSTPVIRFWAWYSAVAKDHDGGYRLQSATR